MKWMLIPAAAGVIWAVPEKGDAARGQTVFENNCADCHYPDSKEEKVGPGLQGAKDGKLPDGRPATREKLLDIINTGPAEMPSFKDRISEQEKEDVVAYVMTL
jgi:mono/diheme cytochrome c family protein